MKTLPFVQLPYDDVPEQPAVPHRFAETVRRDITIEPEGTPTTRVAIHEFGSGPPLLLIHGLMTSGYSFRYLLDELGARYRLLMPDLPGSGQSDHPDVYLGPDVLARSVLAMIDALSIRGVPVIGNSMGGYLCMRAALIDPGAMSRLVNLHSPGVPTARMHALWWALRLLPSQLILDRLVRRDPARWVHKNVHYYDESLKSREEHRQYAQPLLTKEGRRAFYCQLHDTLDVVEMGRFVKQLRARPFPIPLLLLYATRDPMVPPSVGERLHALIPTAQKIRLDHASHFAHVDAAPRFAAAIDPFLSGTQ